MTEPSSAQSPLFATELISADAPPPVIVVGLPRSGSTFLGQIISSLDDTYIFDDLYVSQEAKKLGIDGGMDDGLLEIFVGYLAMRLTKRIVNQAGAEDPYFCPRCSEEDVEVFRRAVLGVFAGASPTWPEVTREWLYRLARHHGCSHWGYKTPQDFLELARLAELFPGLRFIFLTRDPRAIMRSFKYVRWQDGDVRQYHPAAYAYYWKMSYERYRRFAKSGAAPILLLRFEDLTRDPHGQAQMIAAFLGVTCTREIPKKSPNSSFTPSADKQLTPSEIWLAQKIASTLMQEAGYTLEACRLRADDLPDLLRSTWRFGLYQAKRFRNDSRARVQIGGYIRGLFTRSPAS